MKTKWKKLLTGIALTAFALAATLSVSVTTQAAGVRENTFVLDQASGVGYQDALRIYANSRVYGSWGQAEIYLPGADNVLSITPSKGLIAKISRLEQYTEDDEYSSMSTSYFKDVKFKGHACISLYTAKPGTYDLTVNVKNSEKQIFSKKIKVYCSKESAVQYVKYGKSKFYGSFVTNKASGKFAVKTGKEFSVKKIQVGGYDKKTGKLVYKTVGNNKNIKLSKVTKGTEESESYYSEYSKETTYYGTDYDYIFPPTKIIVTIYDKKLRTASDYTYTILYKK